MPPASCSHVSPGRGPFHLAGLPTLKSTTPGFGRRCRKPSPTRARLSRIGTSWTKCRQRSIGSAVPVLEWREAARTDLLAVVDYISDDNPDAAQRLKDEIEAKTAKLSERPKLYRLGRVPGTREMVVRPSYVVIYAEDDD